MPDTIPMMASCTLYHHIWVVRLLRIACFVEACRCILALSPEKNYFWTAMGTVPLHCDEASLLSKIRSCRRFSHTFRPATKRRMQVLTQDVHFVFACSYSWAQEVVWVFRRVLPPVLPARLPPVSSLLGSFTRPWNLTGDFLPAEVKQRSC